MIAWNEIWPTREVEADMKYTVVVIDPTSVDVEEVSHLEASFSTLRQALAFQYDLLEELPERSVQLVEGTSAQIVAPEMAASNKSNRVWKAIFFKRLRRTKARHIS